MKPMKFKVSGRTQYVALIEVLTKLGVDTRLDYDVAWSKYVYVIQFYHEAGYSLEKGNWDSVFEVDKRPETNTEDFILKHTTPELTPHIHAEVIKAWAEGHKIEFQNYYGRWLDTAFPNWSKDTNYRIKKEYPKTSLSLSQLQNHYNEIGNNHTDVANLVIKQYIKDTE